ncbi:MAG: hypothetical protein HUJ29_04400 [Gammaproteobacteria bacterium]|nr:hypothetical protein [Gammaproteobacteria bacterium]
MSETASQDERLCPFSKPIIGKWCDCPHAVLAERCSGKMTCSLEESQRERCASLVELFKERARFVLALGNDNTELTHAQSMKIRCGGLLGMQRLLQPDAARPPRVLEVIAEAESRYGELSGFPFSEIVPDIQAFSHRARRNG